MDTQDTGHAASPDIPSSTYHLEQVSERTLSETERADQRRSPTLFEPRALLTASRLGQATLQNFRESPRRHDNHRTVGGKVSAIPLMTGAVSARFPKALAWPLAAILMSVGASGFLVVARRGKGGRDMDVYDGGAS